MKDAAPIEERIGHRFADESLLAEALTHGSAVTGDSADRSNQRLEFLGDAVLELVVGERLFAENPESTEGALTTARARLVKGPSLAAIARRIDLGEFLRVGDGARADRTYENEAVLEDAVEALFGAVYLDGGIPAARRARDRLFGDEPFRADPEGEADENPKGALQELLQGAGDGSRAEYKTVAESGPGHRKTFEVIVRIGGKEAGRGTASSRKTAEAEAAREALGKLRPPSAETR